MAVDIQVPFLPQQGVTAQILQAMQLANELHAHNQQMQLQQQQLNLQAQGQPSLIAEQTAQAKRLDSQTQLEQQQMAIHRELIGHLVGTTPGATPVEQAPTAPAPPPLSTAPAANGVAPSGAAPNGGSMAMGPDQTALSPKDFASPGEYLSALAAQRNAASTQAAPAKAPAQGAASGLRGLIGQTVDSLLDDPSLTAQERKALIASGQSATLQAFATPQDALKGVTATYNDILKQHGDMSRAIKIETIPDSQSSTGYSQVFTHPDGTEAARHIAPAPAPKTLDEASSYLGAASLNYSREATPGNKAALDLAKTQHDAMYADRVAESSRQAAATAQAQGRDYEAMLRTGVNPITKEKLTLANAPAMALVNPATGQVVPQDMLSLYKPSEAEKNTANTARQVLDISKRLKEQIAKNPSLIGPLAGRENQALQKLGYSSYEAADLINDITLLQSAATKMHTGRFSNAILNKMSGIIKPGMQRDEFLGSLASVDDVATRYANEDKVTTVYEYQQRQQFEAQGGAGGGNSFVPGQFSATNPFAPKR